MQYHAEDGTTPRLTECGKTGSLLSLDSACSSGYDSAQPDSRTATPSDLQFGPPEYHGYHFATTASGSSVGLCSNCKFSTMADLQVRETSSCANSISLFSSSTTLSSYSYATNNHLPSTLPSFKSTPKSCQTMYTEKERQETESTCSGGASLVIHTLKRCSDGWTGPLVKPTDPITSRLKLGRSEAIRRQEVIEVNL